MSLKSNSGDSKNGSGGHNHVKGRGGGGSRPSSRGQGREDEYVIKKHI